MKIEKIEWLSKEGSEAEVTVCGENYQIVCFAHPFNLSVGDVIDVPLYAFCTNHIQRSLKHSYRVEKHKNNYSYCITGKLDDNQKGIIRLWDIFIELDAPVPTDVELNDFISFCCDRIDIIL